MKLNNGIFETFPLIQTKRLTLREIRLSDASEIYDMRSNGRVNQFIARAVMQTKEDAEDLISKTNKAFTDKKGIGWAGILRNSNKIIGTCGFNTIDFENLRAEIGGELSIDYWGKNIALEAVSTIVDFGFNNLHLHSIEAKVSPGNRGAIYVLESIGFKKEAHFTDRIFFNGKFYDMAVFSLITERHGN